MRKGRAKQRKLLPDPRYNSQLVSRFVNNLMSDGKKNTAYTVFYGAMDIVAKRTDSNPLEVFEAAVDNIMPSVEVKSRRVGGATFQVPMEVRPTRKMTLTFNWLITYSRKRNEKGMQNKLAAEIIAASKGEGASVKKREDTHRMAEANKAFSHFRF
ncbi:MAG: 30S ribosomal protein S7 [Bacteroidia bacterium]|nr:30S ribosomal protein S7 [Bacteroidia bacterium]